MNSANAGGIHCAVPYCDIHGTAHSARTRSVLPWCPKISASRPRYFTRDGSHGGSLYYAIGPDGQRLYHDVNRAGGPAG